MGRTDPLSAIHSLLGFLFFTLLFVGSLILINDHQTNAKATAEAKAQRSGVWQSRIDASSSSDQKRILEWVRAEVLGRNCDSSYNEDIYAARQTADPDKIARALERQELFCLARLEGEVLAQSAPQQALAVIQGMTY